MASICVAFIVNEPVVLSLDIPDALDWWTLTYDPQEPPQTYKGFASTSSQTELPKKGQYRLELQPGVYGVSCAGELSFAFDNEGAATFTTKADKDPWPVPPPPPPPTFAGAPMDVWNDVIWRSTPSDNPPTPEQKEMFLFASGEGSPARVIHQQRVWHTLRIKYA